MLITSVGLASPFWINAISNVGVLEALRRWKPPPSPPVHPPKQSIGEAMVAGLRHASQNAQLRAGLVRASSFFLFASAYWALLPALTREQLGGGAALYGWLLATIGASAVGSAVFLKRLNDVMGANRLLMVSSCATSLALGLYAFAHHWTMAILASAIAGASWIAAISTLNVSAQIALPDWVRARGLAIFISVFFGALSLGSVVWGAVADRWGMPTAHLCAAFGLLLGMVVTLRWSLSPDAVLEGQADA
jgi:predicted MFS family arabinose efflux permease